MQLSIVVPIYKVENYLPKCIESILNQTYRDFELILIDDGSPDNCPIICDEYEKKDNRIVVIHQENAGVSAARNAGLRVAGGKFIGFVDPDDWIAPNMYAELIGAIVQYNADLSICGYNYYDEEYRVDDQRLYQEREPEVVDQKTLMDRMADMPPTVRHGVVNKLFKHNMINGLSFDEGLHSSEDLEFLDEYICRAGNSVIVHKPLYFNLVRRNSATHGGLSIDSLADSFAVHEQMYRMAVERYPDLKKHSLAFLMDVFLLKLNDAKKIYDRLTDKEKQRNSFRMKEMKKFIKKYAVQAAFDREIYWKTRLYYLFFGGRQ